MMEFTLGIVIGFVVGSIVVMVGMEQLEKNRVNGHLWTVKGRAYKAVEVKEKDGEQ